MSVREISPQYIHHKTRLQCHNDVYNRLKDMRKALDDLKRGPRGDHEWEEELRKSKAHAQQEWSEKMSRMEAALAEARAEADGLRHRKEGSLGAVRQDLSEEVPPGLAMQQMASVSLDSCGRLEARLAESEREADSLRLQLGQRLVQLSRLQLTLSLQTKEMIELEKSFLELQCRMRCKCPSRPRLSASATPPA